MDTNALRAVPLGFTEESVAPGIHFCYIYNDDAQRRKTIAKFLKSGLLGKQKILCLHDTQTAGEILADMAELGLDMPAHAKDMVLKEALAAYCSDGQFSTSAMMALTESFCQQALKEGYAGVRATGEVAWSLAQAAVIREDVMEYEAQINEVFKKYPYTACCQYDARLFDGQTILDVLSVHPMMVVRGQIVKNPFYIEPAVFLQQYRQRQAR